MDSATLPMNGVVSPRLNWDGWMASVRENFPRNLRRYLRVRKMTNKALAAKIGVSNVTVTKWLKGRMSPELGRLDEIATALGVTYLDLLRDEHEKAAPRYDDLIQEFASRAGYKITRDS